MTIFSATDLACRFGVDTLYEGVSFALETNDRLGVVGANGCGKSTLLSMIIGEKEPDEGSIYVARDKRVGILRQEEAFEISELSGGSALEQMYTAFPELLEIEKRSDELSSWLDRHPEQAGSAKHDSITKEYSALQDEYARLDGHFFRSRCRSVLEKMGFSDSDMSLPLEALSGGQKNRLALSRQLCREPDILILDEPTNHLDADTLIWLENYLSGYQKCIITVSHDRYFLDKVTNKTLIIEHKKATLYKGNYSQSRAQHAKDREIYERHYYNQQKEIARQEAYIEQQRRWNRERNIIAAESRQKLLDKMEKLEAPEADEKTVRMKFSRGLPSGNEVLSVRDMGFAYPGSPSLFHNLSFLIKRGERVFITGHNGCGKSTLIRLLLGKLKPTSGVFDFGHNVEIGYYDQENQNLNEKGTVLSEIWDKARICEHFGIQDPLQIIDILTIWGDSADNIHGVDGVGEVGAKKLVGKYGSVENIYEHLDELTPKMQAAFEAARGYIALSKTLAAIKTDVEIDADEESLKLALSFNQDVANLFDRYEFPSLKSLVPCEEGAAVVECNKKHIEINPIPASQVLSEARAGSLVSLRADGEASLALCTASGCASISCDDAELQAVLSDPAIAKTGHGMKDLLLHLKCLNIGVAGRILDTEIMHYLLNPERTHKLEFLAQSYLGADLTTVPEAVRTEAPAEVPAFDLFSQPVEMPAEKRDETLPLRETTAVFQILPKVVEELGQQQLDKLYEEVEMPLIEVLADMEHTGVKVDVGQLKEYSAQLTGELAEIEAEARRMVDEPLLNLSSPRQVGNVIFEKLALNPRVKRSGRGDYPTDEETLTEIQDKHPFVGKLLEYRALKKLISTYLDPLPALVNPVTGRIHTTFNQALTATGRLSSVRPNLQNIPVRTSRGREIRKAFVSGFDGGYVVSADYSQIELRLMAHLSQDPSLVDGFLHGADIHADTASRIFGVPLEQVQPEQRRQAKVANFGIIYGISAFGLAQRMGISRTESKSFIEQYFIHFPKVKEYMQHAVDVAREKGYVETIFGRKRFLPDIQSKNVNVRSLAERNAINAPIQGSAADIIKLAMNRVHAEIRRAGLRSRMVLQVHDELVLDVAPEEMQQVMDIVKHGMEEVCTLSVPLTAECNYGGNWLEAH